MKNIIAKIEKETKIIEWLVLVCPECNKKIKGRTQNHADSNLRRHQETHEKKETK